MPLCTRYVRHKSKVCSSEDVVGTFKTKQATPFTLVHIIKEQQRCDKNKRQ